MSEIYTSVETLAEDGTCVRGDNSILDSAIDVWYTNEILDVGGTPEFRVTPSDMPDRPFRCVRVVTHEMHV